MKGYAGKILTVDLAKKECNCTKTSEEMARGFLGGNGFGVALVASMVPPGADPFSPDNCIVISAGPLCGTEVPCASKMVVSGKSPMTNGFFDSVCGGQFGAEMKQAGYDAIVVKGRADQPVHIIIDNNRVAVEPAWWLWGKSTGETQRLIKLRKGSDYQVACIGPAGENMVRYANIIHARRAAGRGGLGAVLGYKNIKAISVRGNRDISVKDLKGLREWVTGVESALRSHPLTGSGLPTFGTPGTVKGLNAMGKFGALNFQEEYWPEAEKINGDAFKNLYSKKGVACFGCPIACSHIGHVADGKYSEAFSEGPDFETIFALGSMCANADLSSIILADQLCDQYGIDTISMGVTLSFAMECYQRGILDKTKTGGIDLDFGNHRAIIELITKVAYRSGFGDLLAEGSLRMARRLGEEAHYYAMQVKGLEIAGHSPRSVFGYALGMAVCTKGGSHLDSRPTIEYERLIDPLQIEGKARYTAEILKMTAVGDSMVICRFVERIFGYTINWNEMQGKSQFERGLYVDPINLVTGFDLDLDRLREIGERIYSLERLYNIKCGFSREDDTLPGRMLTEKIPSGPSAGLGIDKAGLQKMLDDFYKYMGWDSDGIPTEKRLLQLGLSKYL